MLIYYFISLKVFDLLIYIYCLKHLCFGQSSLNTGQVNRTTSECITTITRSQCITTITTNQSDIKFKH